MSENPLNGPVHIFLNLKHGLRQTYNFELKKKLSKFCELVGKNM